MGKYKDAQPAPGTSQSSQQRGTEKEREGREREEHRDIVTGNNHNTVTSDPGPVMVTTMLRRAGQCSGSGISGIER